MVHFEITRRQIRSRVREVIRDNLKIHRFSARTAQLSLKDLPAALLYFPSEKVISQGDETTERELELRIEVAIIPSKDPEDEVFDLADQVEALLLSDPGLEELTAEVRLESSDYLIDGDGTEVIAAARQTYRILYLVREA